MGMLYSHIGEAETEVLPRFSTAELDDYAERYRQIHRIDDPDEYMRPLRTGARHTERRLRQEFRRRGWLSEAVLAVLTASRRTRRSRRAPSRGKHA